MSTESLITRGVASFLAPIVNRRLSRAILVKPFLASLESEGPGPARRLLDERLPSTARIAVTGARGGQAQRQRMAALTILGDAGSLRAEPARHEGLLALVIQPGGMALLGLALLGEDPQGASDALDALAERGRRESTLARYFAAGMVEAFAELSRALGGTPMSAAARRRITGLLDEGGMQEVVLLHALHRAHAACGQTADAVRVATRLRGITTVTLPTRGADIDEGP